MIAFLKNNSGKSVDNGYKTMTTGEFKTFVEEIISEHGFLGTVIPAVWIDARREDERYGVLYLGDEVKVSHIADVLYAGTFQGRMPVSSDAEFVGSEPGVQCYVEVKDESMLHLTYNLHNALRQSGLTDLEIVIAQDEGRVWVWSISTPGADAEAWRRQAEAFFRENGLQPLFLPAQVRLTAPKPKAE